MRPVARMNGYRSFRTGWRLLPLLLLLTLLSGPRPTSAAAAQPPRATPSVTIYVGEG